MEMNPTSIERIKSLLKDTGSTIEEALRKQLTLYDKVDSEKEKKKAKSTFLLAYKSVFIDSLNVVMGEVCRNKRLELKIIQSGKSLLEISRESGVGVSKLQNMIDGVWEAGKYKKQRVAEVLGCKEEELFD